MSLLRTAHGKVLWGTKNCCCIVTVLLLVLEYYALSLLGLLADEL